tara:strand:- start:116 stop:289 length:174 start_codon:yes stop_codon:yes gene_type:complete
MGDKTRFNTRISANEETDAQGSTLINGVHKDLHNNPEYKKRFERMLKLREKQQNKKK